MAGHNKWSKVKHIKARLDAEEGKVLHTVEHEIAVATRNGSGDQGINLRLRSLR